MSQFADLEIGLHHHDGAQYWIELRLRRPYSDKIDTTEPELVSLDLDHLGGLAGNVATYGRALADSLVAEHAVKERLAVARASAAAQRPPVPLRLRLRLSSRASELHAVRWETLRDPQHLDAFLATDEGVLISRYLRIWDEREVILLPRGDLRALVVIANPVSPAQWQLEPVDVPGELARARAGLGDIPMVALCRLDAPDPVCVGNPDVGNLFTHLREGYDILYLACHGKLLGGGAQIWLEGPGGVADVISADEAQRPGGEHTPGLVTQLRQLPKLPRLVVLASCQSAGIGEEWASRDQGALSALGPRLVEAGVPAVVAMQGNVTMETMADFMPSFFTELRRDGQIDRAMAVARARVVGRGRHDWWVPVLFMRLESGQLFTERGTRAPFMVGELKGFIPRVELSRQVVDHLVDGQGKPRATTLALHGSGGFGKTTMAQSICHDRRVQDAFSDGILWATLGESPQILGELTRLYTTLSGEPRNFGGIEDAVRELAHQLVGKHCLLVIDDVWATVDLQPFLEGGKDIARLITTRLFEIAAEAPAHLPVDVMTPEQAVQLLATHVEPPPSELEPFYALADRLGHWPLMLELAGAALRKRLARGEVLNAALTYLNQALDIEGVIAFDRHNANERNQAIANTIRASLKLLTTEEQARFTQLAVFPPDIDIPLSPVGQLWGLTAFKTGRACEALSDLSLLKLDLAGGTVRLHHVMRSYLATPLAALTPLHIMLVNAWGDSRRLPYPYAWRWIAYHLAEAARGNSRPDERHAIAERLVTLTVDKDFQTAHLEALRDPASLLRDLERGLATAASDHHDAALPLVVQAALGLIEFRRQRLAPAQIFAHASAGQVQAAEQYLGLFATEGEWRQAASLVIAWLAIPHHREAAQALYTRVEAQLRDTNVEPLRSLADWVTAALVDQRRAPQDLPTEVSRDLVDAIIARMAGLKDKLGLPAEGAYEAVSETAPTTSSYEASVRMTTDDSAQLVAYAAAHPHEGRQYVEDHLAILAANSYIRYRNRFLWPLLRAVLRHPEPAWVQELTTKVVQAALAPNKLEFQEGLPITVLALQALSGKPLARQQLDQYWERVRRYAEMLVPDESRGDSWGSYTRRLAALAQAYAMLGEQAMATEQLALAQTLHFGFAGFQAPAWLTLAETVRACGGEERTVAEVLNAARDSAHNVQEPTFCAQTTARYNALVENWWGAALDHLDLTEAVQELCTHPDDPRFAALHHVGEGYSQRGSRGHYAPLPPWVRDVSTLRGLAQLYGRLPEDVRRVNPGWHVDQSLSSGIWIRVPDPELAPLLAARLAAEVLVGFLPSPHQGVELLQSLVPVAAASPTALDTVLARLLVAVAPVMGPGISEALTQPFGDVAQHLDRLLTADIPPPFTGQTAT